MTGNEIIKAMNYCCGNIEKDGECKEDMCYQATLSEDRNGDIRWCRQWLMKDALDLISRQREELNKYPIKTIVSNNCEIHSKTSKDYDNLMADIKSEAIKEFAERLKALKIESDCIQFGHFVTTRTIDNLVKEMTEETNG